MKKIYMCVLGIGAMMMLQSCYVQTLSVGMNEGDPVKQVAVVKNHQFIDGLVEPRYDKVENYVEDTQHFKTIPSACLLLILHFSQEYTIITYYLEVSILQAYL